MRISEERKQEIVATFRQTFKDKPEAEEKVKTLTLEELRQTDEMVGPVDVEAGYRIAIRNEIRRREEQMQRVFEGKVRAGYIVVGIVSAVLSGVIVFYLTN